MLPAIEIDSPKKKSSSLLDKQFEARDDNSVGGVDSLIADEPEVHRYGATFYESWAVAMSEGRQHSFCGLEMGARVQLSGDAELMSQGERDVHSNSTHNKATSFGN